MQWQLFFISIPPILVYAVCWAYGAPRFAVLAAILISSLELLYNSVALRFVEPFSCLSLVACALLGVLSLQRNDERFFKLQPVAFELCVAAVLVYYDVVRDTALLAVVVDEHLGLHEALEVYQRGYATVYATTLSKSLPFMLIVHAALTAYGAWGRSTWWWFNVRVFGFYGMLAVLFFGERLLGING